MDKPRLDQGPDYERGFIDGMMYQTQTTVNKAVNAMASRIHTPEDVKKIMKPWVGLTDEEITELRLKTLDAVATNHEVYRAIETKLKEKNT